MKISTRTQAILAATVFFFIISLFVIANAFIVSAYSHIELQQSDANIQLVADQFRYDTDQLGTKARDWAVWDDTYQFMEDQNTRYSETVVHAPTTFESLQVSGLIYFDSDGNVVACQGYDLRNKTRTNLSQGTLSSLTKTLGVLSNTRGGKKKQGIVLLPDGPALVGMHTILQTNGMGTGHGTLVMLQPFDESRIRSVQDRLHLPVKVWPLDSPVPVSAHDLETLISAEDPPRISQVQDPSTLVGFYLLDDIENTPILLVGVETPRTVSQQIFGNLICLIAAFTVIGVIYILITGYLLRRYIISPLTDLDTTIKRIGSRRDLSERLPAGDGDDEITSLRETFNALLQDLQDKEAELTRQGELLAESHRNANMYLDIYLDVLTYEILNVTVSLQAYAELIRESGDTRSREYADRIAIALNRNLSVIRNIETISAIYKHPPGRIPVDLQTFVETEIQKYSDKNIRYTGGRITVLADEMLAIVFHNLLLNAIRFGRDDLRIDVSARDLNNGTVEISVTDNGSGISDDLKPRIFDRFMRGSDKRSSYGLGLHIVKMLIDAYGGKVWADDRVAGKPEEGAALRFTLKKG